MRSTLRIFLVNRRFIPLRYGRGSLIDQVDQRTFPMRIEASHPINESSPMDL